MRGVQAPLGGYPFSCAPTPLAMLIIVWSANSCLFVEETESKHSEILIAI